MIFYKRGLNLRKVPEKIFSLCFFLIIFLPSLKFFWFGPILNVIVFAFVVSLVFYSVLVRDSLTVAQAGLLFFWIFWFSLFFVSFFRSYFIVSISDYLRVVFVLASVVFVCVCKRRIDENLLVLYISSWTLFLCASYWFGLITPTGSGDLSYLNFTMQIGVGAMVLLPYISRRPTLVSIFFLSIVFTIFDFPGRTAIISVIFISIVFVFLWGVSSPRLGLIFSIVFPFVAFAGILNIDAFFSDYTLYKFKNLLDGNDPRFLTYMEALDVITTNPFGVGFQQHYNFLGFYPHNIFLEIGMAAGIIPVIVMIAFVLYTTFKLLVNFGRLKKSHSGRAAIGLSLSSFYLFMYWNFSFELGSAYGLFSLLSFFVLTDWKREI
ncbi:hypothetical protein ACSEE7_09595 [Halomonas cupida]|uniref:hypothetical protein n=1 Tax=Halomonas cupida TaxID=44933 RepID=UPI003EF4561E